MVESIVGLIAGPIVGAIGGVVNQYMAYKVKGLEIKDNANKRAHDKEMAALQFAREKAITSLEIAGRERQTIVEGEIDIAKIDLSNLGLAIGADKAAYLDPEAQKRSPWIAGLMAVVDFIRGLIRPLLTAFLAYGVWRMTKALIAIAQSGNDGVIDPAVAGDLLRYTVIAVLQLAAVAIGYWYGSRPTVFKRVTDVAKDT